MRRFLFGFAAFPVVFVGGFVAVLAFDNWDYRRRMRRAARRQP